MPTRQQTLAGTVGVTAVGMFAGGGGWGIAFQVHTLEVVIGGIAKRPVVTATGLQEHDWLQLTVSVDHDVVDGAPAARFVALLRRLLTSADLLAALNGPADPDRPGLVDVQLKSN